MLQPCPCIPDRELPVNPFLPMISVQIPSRSFRFQRIDVADSPSQTLFGEGGQFNLGHVQPGTMLRGVMKFEILPNTPGLGWLKRFIQRGDVVRVQVITYKDNLICLGKSSSTSCLISCAQSVLHRCSRMDTLLQHSSGAINMKPQQVPLRTYSWSTFSVWLSEDRWIVSRES